MPKIVKKTPGRSVTKEGDVLTEQEELFCQYYVLDFKRIEAAEKAYNIDKTKKGWRNTCSVMAQQNLLKPHINRRIRELLDKYHVNPEAIDNETAFLMRQNAELSSKLGAIKEFNRVLGRYEKDNEQQKTEINVYNWEGYEEKPNNNLPPEMVDKAAS